MSKFLLPPVDPSKVGRRRSLSWRRRLLDSIEEKAMQARKNWQMYLFLFAIFAVNVVSNTKNVVVVVVAIVVVAITTGAGGVRCCCCLMLR